MKKFKLNNTVTNLIRMNCISLPQFVKDYIFV